ncbi:MAG: S-layer homology domain-containing protein, partial [Clostridia bacterium]|nr:S-layer homology domain-containing protein [Clostridia bacterium]
SMATNTKTGFADDDDIAPWARGYVNVALREKWFVGYDDNEYKPNRIISRQELIAVIMRLAGSTEAIEPDYLDADAIHGYAKNFVGHASELGIVNGYPDGTFRPLNDVTRAEVAKILYFGLEYVNYTK